MITIYLIRHGQTPGNLQRRYVGRTDEPLCSTAIEQICAQGELYRKAFSTTGGGKTLETIYVSPMLRCKQTAELLFPGVGQTVVTDFREMDFGAFEYKNYQELSADARYQAFIDSGGQTDFPEAETQSHFRARVTRAFGHCVAELLECDESTGVFVVHGGTVMAILEAYAKPYKSYFEWQIEAGAGYCCELEVAENGFCLTHLRLIANG